MHRWRERLERWLTPLARRAPLSPNAISLLAFCSALGGATLFALAPGDASFFLYGVGMVAIAGFLDAFDGIVARVQKKESRFGDFLDHFLDRGSDLAILSGWLIGAEVSIWIALPAVALVALVGYIGTQLEASFRERSYEGTGRGEFILALVAFPLISYGARRAQFDFASIDDGLALILIAFTIVPIVGRLRVARRLAAIDQESR